MQEQSREQKIWEEMTFLLKEVFFDLITYVFQKPFDYFVLDSDNNEYYRKWNKIEIYSKEDSKKNIIKRNMIAKHFNTNRTVRCLSHRACMCIDTKRIHKKHSRTCVKVPLVHL